ncbi:5-oxoprolinase subunit PxpA [Sphingobacterium griseoflavum]|uniref:5-oxoprolinase subunit A n=1 Tax=Sphingobacterium griseoflavum TaxID=1474952 RepID=A0ABQ3I1S2_9SPHI|nr:5-oxoprolinase subunit PxpA [Sphingobacterium griseoflavum]GHE41926.1 UPF0271 protein YcsF [Sphingobacterium griseoflavum]
MKNKRHIDLNCDIGESYGSWIMGNDAAILPYVSAVNIACGFHAGDPSVMMDTLALAARHDVHIGAHPGFQDLQGFGRRELQVTPREVYNLMVYQIGALMACARCQELSLRHVKPHGALYNLAARSASIADAIASAVYDVDPSLIIYGLSGSALTKAGLDKGLRVQHEVFADRTYQADGSLTPRTDANALIANEDDAVEQVLKLAKTGRVMTAQGTEVQLQVDTICLHGDNMQAVAFAMRIANALANDNINIG